MNKKVLPAKKIAAALLALTSISASLPVLSSISSYAAEQSGSALTYYVSPSGSDSAAGTIDAPFATIQKARDTIRALDTLPEGGITVYLREGRYYQPETLEFTEEDSGTAECPITYKAYEGEKAVIDGGYTLDKSKFTVPDQAILDRMQTEDAKSHLRAYDLAAEGLSIPTVNKLVGGLYIDGVRCWLGRYPNDGHADGIPYVYFESLSGQSFIDSHHRVENWSEEAIADARMYGMFEIDWTDSQADVVRYDRAANRVYYSSSSYATAVGRYFYFNVLEEIDVPGEYYIDRDGILYVYLPDDCETVSFAQCGGSVVDAAVDYYTFDGINFENGVEDILHITGNNVTVQNSTLICCGEKALDFDGTGITVYNNEIAYTGASAMHGNGGDMKYLIPSKNLIDNNKIHHFGEIRRVYNGSISLGEAYADGDFRRAVGVTISHNEIYEAPHTALSYVVRDVLVEYNYIHDVCYEAGDAGAIYDGGWDSNETIYRYNLLENVGNSAVIGLRPVGIYIDAAGAGKRIHSNIFVNVLGNGVHTSGMDTTVYNNLLVNTSGIYTDSQAYYPTDWFGGGIGINGWGCIAWLFKSGSYVYHGKTYDMYNSGWGGFFDPNMNPAYGTKMWAYRHPWTMLVKATNVYRPDDKYVAFAYGDSTIRGNVLCPSSSTILSTVVSARLINFKDNIILGNVNSIGFADFAGGDYTLSEDSAIYRDLPGFKAADFAQIGVQPAER